MTGLLILVIQIMLLALWVTSLLLYIETIATMEVLAAVCNSKALERLLFLSLALMVR
jgi:hypothetical protein